VAYLPLALLVRERIDVTLPMLTTEGEEIRLYNGVEYSHVPHLSPFQVTNINMDMDTGTL
jgi:hypothetical protein